MSVVKKINITDPTTHVTTLNPIGALAGNVDYDNTTSGLVANNVQNAIDELIQSGGGTFYGTSTGQAANQNKTATIPSAQSFRLKTGVIVGIKYDANNTYSATATSPVTLNVNNTGAFQIYYSNTATPTGTNTTAFGVVNRVIYYLYDGTYWVWAGSSADNNSDTRVTQTATSTNANYEVLFSQTADNTTRTEEARKDSGLTFNPSTDTLSTKYVNPKVIKALIGSGTAGKDAGSGVSPRYTPTLWNFNVGVTVADGEVYFIKIPEAGGTYGVWLSLNNGTNYYPVAVSNSKGRFQTHYAKNTVIAVTYESAGVCNCFARTGADSTADVTGCFRVLDDYDANTTYSNMSVNELKTGTATASRVLRATDLKNGINQLIDARVVANPSATPSATMEKLTVGSTTYKVGGGHAVKNSSGTAMTQRENLQFNGVYVQDNSSNNTTIVNVVKEYANDAEVQALTGEAAKGFQHTPENVYRARAAADITFDPTNTLLTQTRMQEAMEELDAEHLPYSSTQNMKQKIDEISTIDELFLYKTCTTAGVYEELTLPNNHKFSEYKMIAFYAHHYGNVYGSLIEPIALFNTHSGTGNNASMYLASDASKIYSFYKTSDTKFMARMWTNETQYRFSMYGIR